MKKNFNVANIITIVRALFLVPFFVFTVLFLSDSISLRKGQILENYNHMTYGTEPFIPEFSNFIPQIIISIIFILIASLDLLDGYIARKNNTVTSFGTILDPIVDKVQIIGTMILLNIFNFLPVWVTILIVLRELVVTILRFVVKHKRGFVSVSSDKLGKYKTLSQTIAVLLFLLPFWLISSDLYIISWVFMVLALVITFVSAINYCVKYVALMLD